MGESLVVAHDQGRALHLLDDVRHGKRLARSRNTKQCNGIHTIFQGIAYALDRSGLIARRLVFGIYLKLHVKLSFRARPQVESRNPIQRYKNLRFSFRKFYYLCVILYETTFYKTIVLLWFIHTKCSRCAA